MDVTILRYGNSIIMSPHHAGIKLPVYCKITTECHKQAANGK